VAQELKVLCMRLQNSSALCVIDGMSEDAFKSAAVECIKLVAKFMQDRIDECPCLIHILDKYLN